MKRLLFVLLALVMCIPLWAQVAFKSNSSDTKFSLIGEGTVANFNGIQYAVTNDNRQPNSGWNNLTSTEVSVSSGKYIWLKSKGNNSFYIDDKNYRRFKITGSAEIISGNIGTLCNEEWGFQEKSFWGLFQDCTGLTSAKKLSFTTYKAFCYKNMFKGCKNLKEIPGIDLNQGYAESCCEGMFEGCTSLEDASNFIVKLYWPTLQKASFKNMFKDCKSLKKPIYFEGSHSAVAESCFESMYEGCVALETAQGGTALSGVAKNCYKNMYKDCESLKTVPSLPATTLAEGCYYGMFQGCKSIEAAPELPASTLVKDCYNSMFVGCIKLSFISTRFTDWKEDLNATTNWVQNVSPTGIFMGMEEIAAFPIRNKSHIPVGWKVSIPNYFCMTVDDFGEENKQKYRCLIKTTTTDKGNRYIDAGISYSYDGINWTLVDQYNQVQLDIRNKGTKVYFRATETFGTFSTASKKIKFDIQGKVSLSGNIQSLIDLTMVRADVPDYSFYQLFSDCATKINDISELRMPATEVGAHAYEEMFKGCNNIDVAPQLPATKLGVSCYQSMFENCTKLVTAPELPATTLAENCYNSMFKECDALCVAPHLPAKNFKNSAGATATGCYNNMFYGCGELHYISVEFTAWNNDCTSTWIQGVAGTGTFAKPSTLSRDIELVWGLPTYNRYPRDLTHQWGSEVYGKDAICFMSTNNSSNVVIKVFKKGKNFKPSLQYDTKEVWPNDWNGTINWNNNLDEQTITIVSGDHINGSGKSLFISASNNNTCLYQDPNNYIQFIIEQNSSESPSIEMRGNIMSLLRSDCNVSDVPNRAFKNLFKDCKYLRSTPNLPCGNSVGVEAYAGMFAGCTGLVSTPELPATTLSDGCYSGMFEGCSGLQYVKPLEVKTMKPNCYQNMFKDCTKLTAGPDLPADILAEYCYSGMFQNTALTHCPALEADILRAHCYENMFKGCKYLVAAPDLQSDRLADYCYSGMFEDCYYKNPTTKEETGLVTPPVLESSNLRDYCYQNMFKGCKLLTTAPTLSSRNLREGCYKSMFENCVSLTAAPELPAVTLQRSCYERMFYGCKNLTNMKVGFNAWPDVDLRSTYQWVDSVAAKGTMVCSKALSSTETLSDGTKTGRYDKDGSYLPRDPQNKWLIVNDYLCFTNEQINPSVVSFTYASSLAANIHIEYMSSSNIYTSVSEYNTANNTNLSQDDFNKLSKAEKIKPWSDYTSGQVITLDTKGDNVFFRAKIGNYNTITKSQETEKSSRFNIPATHTVNSKSIPNLVSVSGDIRSLLKEAYDEVSSLRTYEFGRLFYNCKGLVFADGLKLPSFVSSCCYAYMFFGCNNLVSPPFLPAENLSGATYCYYFMFHSCYNLLKAPALPATTLAAFCYTNLFYCCKELVTAPELPATTLANNCYQNMFDGCTSLVDAPYLPAQNLKTSCYDGMFANCTSLRSIDVNFSSWTSAPNATNNWVKSWGGEPDNPVGDFRCPKDLTEEICDKATGNYSRIPKNWRKELNIIAHIPNEEGEYPNGFSVSNSQLEREYQFTSTSEEETVLYSKCPSSGTTTMVLSVPDYARVVRIRIEGTTSDEVTGSTDTVKVSKYSNASKVYGQKTLNGYGSAPSTFDFDIDDQGSFTEKTIISVFAITLSKGFYGKITLYGESYPYCNYPQMEFDYEKNELKMSAQAGTSIYYTTDPDFASDPNLYTSANLSAHKIFKYTEAIPLQDWVDEATGYDEIVYYAVAKFDNNSDVKPSAVNKCTIGRYAPKMAGYCIVDDNNASSFVDAVKYANLASHSIPVKVYVPEGEYDLSTLSDGEMVEIAGNVSVVGDGVERTIIKGNGATVIKLTGHDAYLQDLKIEHKSGASATALEDNDLNIRKVALVGKYKYMGAESAFSSWTATNPNSRAQDDTQIGVAHVSHNGSTYSARLNNGQTTSAYLLQVYNSSDELEAWTMTETSDFYLKLDLADKKVTVRAANNDGGFGEPCEASAQTTHGSTEVFFTDADGNPKSFSTNSSGYGTFSHAHTKNVRVIGASAYYAKFEMGKIRLQHINDDDVILKSSPIFDLESNKLLNDKRGVIFFGAPNTPLHFYEDDSTPSVPDNDLYATATQDKVNDHYVSGSAEEGIWVLSGSQVLKLAEGKKVLKHRAYFDLQPTSRASTQSQSSALRMVFGYWNWGNDEENDENQSGAGFDDVPFSPEILDLLLPEVKLIPTKAYTLDGQRTSNLKGLIVKNGKVVMIK